jgi:hypothetical protein
VEAAIRAAPLTGPPDSVFFQFMTYEEARAQLTEWGGTLAITADMPPPDAPVWLVRLIGRGLWPGAIFVDRGEVCMEVRVIILDDSKTEETLVGDMSDECR